MSANSSGDRESLQKFLASAFAVQESHIDSQFLSAFLGVQRSVAEGELGIDGVMNLVVDSARNVADAAGVAIGLLEGDHLVYRAGSGCSALWKGARFAASLTHSSKLTGRREILRVEDAHTDTRIEGAICRQFGAEALLILPIYHDRLLAGVMEILFREPHAFQDCEVQMYRLMAGLIEEAMLRGVQPERNLVAEPTVPIAMKTAVEQSGANVRKLRLVFFHRIKNFHLIKDVISNRWVTSLAAVRGSRVFRRHRDMVESAAQRATESISRRPLQSMALTAVVVALGLTFWVSHGSRKPISPMDSPDLRKSNAVSVPQPGDVKPAAAVSETPSTLIPVKKNKVATTPVRRVRAAHNEIDYMGDDVTVRHFTYKNTKQRATGRVANIGDDVTVRYLSPKPAQNSQSQ